MMEDCLMSERITLELPDALAQAVREEAERTGQTLGIVVLKRLQQAYDNEYLHQHITPDATYEVSFPVTDEASASDMMVFLKSLKNGDPHS
jgi:hypothetical protein